MDTDEELCECGKRTPEECRDAKRGECPLMPEPPDERYPSAQERWYLGY